MTKHMIATKNQECRLIVPVSKKAISAVGIDEKCVYAARFEDSLLIIGDLLEGFAESVFEHGKDIGYENGFNEGYEEGLWDGKKKGLIMGYHEGYDDAVEGAGFHDRPSLDCGLDCNYDCENCRFNGD